MYRTTLVFVLAQLAWPVSYTTISDTVLAADGSPMVGQILIQWPTFQASDGTTISGGSKRIAVTSGTVSTSLVAGGAYTATYYVAGLVVSKEIWNIPQSATPIRIATIRTIVPIANSATAIQGVPVDSALPTHGSVLQYDQVRGKWISQLMTLGAHSSSHQHGGADEVATATPAANAIPKAGAGATLGAGWIPDLSGVYSVVGHNHSGVYAPVSHTHGAGDILSAPWPAYSSGTSPPAGSCTAPAVYAETGTDPDTMYHCSGGTWQQIGGTGSTGDSWTGDVDLGYVESGRTVCGTFSATGATVGTALAPAWPALEDGLRGIAMRVSQNNTIEVCAINDSLSAIDPAIATFAASANGGRAASGGSASFPPMTGKAGYSLKVNATATDVEWSEDIPGAGMDKTPVAGGYVWSVDSTQIPYLAANNAFLGDQTLAARVITSPSQTQTLAATDAITVSTAANKSIASASDITLTSAPTIAAGVDGQHAWLVNVGSYSITLQDADVLANSNLCTIANANLVIAPKAACHLLYSAAAGCWIEVK